MFSKASWFCERMGATTVPQSLPQSCPYLKIVWSPAEFVHLNHHFVIYGGFLQRVSHRDDKCSPLGLKGGLATSVFHGESEAPYLSLDSRHFAAVDLYGRPFETVFDQIFFVGATGELWVFRNLLFLMLFAILPWFICSQ